MPTPAEAEEVTVEVVGVGAVTLMPDGKFQRANVRLQIPVPAGGSALTVRLAVAVFVVLSASTNRLLVVFVYVATAVVVTFTLITQLAFAAIVPLENERDVAAAAGAKAGEPQPVVVAFGVLATAILLGNGSVKLNPLIAPPLGLVIVMVSAEMPLTLVGFGLKLLEMVTLVGSTIAAKRVPVE